MEKGKKHAPHAITGFELTKDTLNNLSQYDITPTAKLVLLYLTSCYNPKNGLKVFPKQKTIAQKIGVCERSVVRAVQELFKAGLILIECKSSNRYLLRLKKHSDVSGSPKNFCDENMSDDTDKMSDAHVHEQIKEQKTQQEDDFYLKRAVEKMPWVNNKVAYINGIKRNGGAEKLIRDEKAIDRNAKAMLNRTQQVIENARIAAELAEPPSEGWKEFGRKHGICKTM